MECYLKNITVHYEMVGEGRPVILLHGWPLDHRSIAGCMEPIFAQRPGWQRFYPDLPGIGQTHGPAWINSQDQMLQVVLCFIDKVLPEQQFVLVGLSYGGYLARGVVYHRPEAVAGLLLLVPTMTWDFSRAEGAEKVTLVPDPALIAQLEPAEAEGFEFVAVVQNRQVWKRYQTDIQAGYLLRDEKFLAQIPEGSEFSFKVDNLAEPFAKPTLIVTGRQDPFVGYRDQWEILENYPRASFVVVDRAGHLLYIEQEALFVALVHEWLDRVEAGLR